MTKTKMKDIKVYSKEASYRIGEKIRHEVFKDEGVVKKKVPYDGDYQKIIVKFSRLGQKTLIEKKAARRVKMGDTVSIRYEAALDDGKVVDASRRKKIILGKNKLFPSVERQMVGMKEGDARTISLQPEQAYGRYDEDLVMPVSKNTVSGGNPKIGDRKVIRRKDGALVEARITEIQTNRILLDANHPYAGRAVDYTIELMKFMD